MTQSSPRDLIAQRLRTLAPAAAVDRVWGRMTAVDYERIHHRPRPQDPAHDQIAWGADPEDIADEIVTVLHEARLVDPAEGEVIYSPIDEAKDVWE